MDLLKRGVEGLVHRLDLIWGGGIGDLLGSGGHVFPPVLHDAFLAESKLR